MKQQNRRVELLDAIWNYLRSTDVRITFSVFPEFSVERSGFTELDDMDRFTDVQYLFKCNDTVIYAKAFRHIIETDELITIEPKSITYNTDINRLALHGVNEAIIKVITQVNTIWEKFMTKEDHIMRDVICKEITREFSDHSTGAVPMFSFAVNDYVGSYQLGEGYFDSHKKLFAAILNQGDVYYAENGTESFETLMKAVIENSSIDMLIFDHNKLTMKECLYLQEEFPDRISTEGNKFAELEDVYEDRFVFVRIPKKEV